MVAVGACMFCAVSDLLGNIPASSKACLEKVETLSGDVEFDGTSD